MEKNNNIDPYIRTRKLVEEQIRQFGEEQKRTINHNHYLKVGLSLIGNAESQDKGIRTLSDGLYNVWLKGEPEGFSDKPENVKLKDQIIGLYKEKKEKSEAMIAEDSINNK